jgi:hypothetical protein
MAVKIGDFVMAPIREMHGVDSEAAYVAADSASAGGDV